MPQDPAPTPSRPDSRPRNGLAIGLVVAGVLTLLDQVVKTAVEQVLEPGRFVPWLSDSIGWQLVHNDGGAFGLPAPSWFFLVVTVVVVTIVVRNLPRVTRIVPAVSYGLLLAGALGNAIDRVFRLGDAVDPRFFHGHVVDFVAWGTFPRFNVADAAISVGFALLFLDLLRHPEPAPTAEAGPDEARTDADLDDRRPGPGAVDATRTAPPA